MRLTPEERRAYAADGFVVRERIFFPAELEQLRATAEDVAARVIERAERPDAGPSVTLADGHRMQFSSSTVIQWEWAEGSREIRLIEPFTHLHPCFDALWTDPRFVEPMKDAVGSETVGPYTCKMNLKRPREGSAFPWHQDYPYWYIFTHDAGAVATVMLFLDDATAANGAMRVLPGSHRHGPVPRDRAEPTKFPADVSKLDTSRERVVEVPAGSALFFSCFLVHRSAPNDSTLQRRTVLLSYQPAGRPRQSELQWHPERVDELP